MSLHATGWEEGEEYEQEISKIHPPKTADPRKEKYI